MKELNYIYLSKSYLWNPSVSLFKGNLLLIEELIRFSISISRLLKIMYFNNLNLSKLSSSEFNPANFVNYRLRY